MPKVQKKTKTCVLQILKLVFHINLCETDDNNCKCMREKCTHI